MKHGWKPESEFLDYRWEGYDEALLLYVLGLGSPTNPGEPGDPYGWWVSPWHFGPNQGPIVLMIENYRSGLS